MNDTIRFSDGHEEPVEQALAWAKTVTQPSSVPEKAIPVRTERNWTRSSGAEQGSYKPQAEGSSPSESTIHGEGMAFQAGLPLDTEGCAAPECPVHHGGNGPYCPEQET